MLICAYFGSWQLVYALKSVGNLGLAAPVFVPLLQHFMLSQSSLLELRLAAIYALRRYPCSVDVSPNTSRQKPLRRSYQRGRGERQSSISR